MAIVERRDPGGPSDPPVVLVMSTHESGNYEGIAEAAGAIAFVPKSQFSMDTLEEVWSIQQRATFLTG